MEKAVKKTKAMYFAELREMVIAGVEDEEERAALVEFIDKQVDALEKRKVSAAARAEKKKEESDALTEAIFDMIGDELITVDEIVVALDTEGVTRNKVTARLGKLVKAERIVKGSVKVDGKKRMAYCLPGAEVVDEDAEE